MDKWFASVENLVFIDEILKKSFICPLKKNRKVALSSEDKKNGKYVSIASVDTEGLSGRRVYLEGIEKPLKITKQVFTNGDDDSLAYLYLISIDIDSISILFGYVSSHTYSYSKFGWWQSCNGFTTEFLHNLSNFPRIKKR